MKIFKGLPEQYLNGAPRDYSLVSTYQHQFSAIVLSTCLLLALMTILLVSCTPAHAQEVDIAIISTIESSNNPKAHNNISGSTGLCQITQSALSEFNHHFHKNYSLISMYDGRTNLLVADWYINNRIPVMLKYYGIPQTIENRIWAYNAGIGNVVKNIMPKETKNYIKKYKRLAKG